MVRLFLFCLLIWGTALGCRQKPDPQPTPQPPTDTTRPDTTRPTGPGFAIATADLAIYEVNLQAQGAAGRFAAFTPQLDSIRALGCNTVWLMPIHPIGQLRSAGGLGSPYAIRDYTATNAEFGSLAEFKALVQAAHTRKLRVILDWVANHTAWDHPWITAHPDWYVRQNGQIIIPPGTNWNDVAELDYTNPAMRLAMIEAMRFWVREAGVDGFRCDAADFVPADFWRQALDSLIREPAPMPLILLAEGSQVAQWNAGFGMTFGWSFYDRLKQVLATTVPTALTTTHLAERNGATEGKYRLRYTTNHDKTAWEETPIEAFGGLDRSMAAFATLLAYGEVPMVYNGQEVGWPQRTPIFTRSTINFNANPAIKAAYRRLLQFRAQTPALRTGSLTTLSTPFMVAILRQTAAQEALVVVNVRSTPQTFERPASLAPTGWTNLQGQPDSLPARLTLPPFGYTCLRRVR